MPPSRTAGRRAGARRAASTSTSARLRRHLRRDVRRLHGRRRRAARRRARAAATCATTWRSRSRRPSPARRRTIRVPTLGRLRVAAAAPAPSRAPSRSPARPATAAASVRAQPGLLHRRAHLPDLPRRRARSSTSRAAAAAAPGRVRKEKTLAVNIPAGVEDGTRIRLAGEGEAGCARRAARRPLHLPLGRAAPLFQRDGADIFCRVPIPMTQAALGGTIEVPTLDGKRARSQHPGRHPVGHAVPPARQGHDACCAPRAAATCTSRSTVETPVNLTKQAEGAARGVREGRRQASRPAPNPKASSPR